MKHGAERLSEAMVLQTGGQLLGATLSSADPQWQQLTMIAYGLGSKVGRELPHSRKQELEADHIGLMYMARAGYDPEAAVSFWQRFAEYAKRSGETPSWLSFLRTHPVDQVRINQLRKLMPAAKAEFARSPAAGGAFSP
jgi:metalloendopeptidase OMA1, mitochondrial